MKAVALVACVALLGGCFAYNSSGKKWAYLADSVLILGGAGAIALDQTSKPAPCMGTDCQYQAPIRGGLIAGIVLVSAGVFGIVFNASRDNVKTSR